MTTVRLAFVVLFAACAGEQGSSSSSLTRTPGACGSVETHVLGSYETGGDSTVILARPGKHVLVLSAYAATTWHVTAEPGATIEHIYAVGYHKQIVKAPAGTDIKTESYDTDGVGACGYAYPGGGECDTSGLLTLAAARVHHDPTSFHGCYAASSWKIGKDLAVTSDCHVDQGYVQSDAITKCDSGGDGGTCGSGSGSSGGGDGPVL